MSTAELGAPVKLLDDQASLLAWPIYRLSVEQYEQMVASGALTEDDRLELLEGYLVPKMPKYPLHDGSIDLIADLLARILPPGWVVRVQNSLLTADSVPEPDVVVARGVPGSYRRQHPRSTDVALVVEVADSSVRRDRDKAAIYARSGVTEYWIINLDESQLERMRGPQPDGSYSQIDRLTADQAVSLTIEGVVVGQIPLTDLLELSVE